MNPRERRQTRARERLAAQASIELSSHAELRARELGYSEDEVLRCVAAPSQTYTCPSSYGPNRRMYQRGNVAVVVDEGARVAVTVLPRTRHVWEHGRDTRRTIFGVPGSTRVVAPG